MRSATSAILATVGLAALAGAWGLRALEAQQPAFKRAVLQKQDLSAPGREAVVALAALTPRAAAGKHTQAGEELGYGPEGSLVPEVEGIPPAPLKAGDVFFVEAGRAHDGRDGGSGVLKVLATYVIEKGEPVATPVQ